MDAGQSSDVHPSAGETEGETVEIKIKTLDAQSYTLRVHKNTPVPVLKDQIATVVGVPVENQRLICRGKVLKDDQLLAAYNVEDGHTLHLVARQPPQPLPLSASSGQEHPGPSGPSDMVIVSPRNRLGHVSHSLLMGTINIPDSGEGGMPDLNRIISAVLNSVGIGNAIPGAAGAGTSGSVAVGVLPSRTQQARGSDGQPRSEGADARLHVGPPSSERNDTIDDIEAQLQLDAIYGVPSPGIFTGTGAAVPPNPFRVIQQPAVVPDALTTMSQYLDRLEQSFSIIDGGRNPDVEGPSAREASASEGAIQAQGHAAVGQTSESLLGRATSSVAPSSSSGPSVPLLNPVMNGDRQGAGVSAGPPAPSRRLPTPAALGTIVNRVQELLSGQAGTALSRLAAQLENEPNLLDSVTREDVQRTALRDGNMMQQLGALLLELGRTTLTLRLGQAPAESVVNAGPAVFISPSGPNPMMVQPLPLQTGVAVGALPSGMSQANGGIVGPTLGPRSINIHIHTSDLRLPSPTQTPPQPPPRTVIGVSSGAPALTGRQIIERADTTNPEHTLTVRQIIERAEASSGGQPGPVELNPQVASSGAVQGAIMTFNENGAMRVVPVRTRTAGVPHASQTHGVHDGDAIFQPLLARFQQQLGSVQHGRPPLSANVGSASGATNLEGPVGATAGGDHPPGFPPPQVHIQAWAPSLPQASAGGSSQELSIAAPVNETHLQSATEENQGEATESTIDPQGDSERAVDGQPAEGLVPGVDVTQIVNSLGPFINQLAVAFQHARTQSPGHELLSEQPPLSQPNMEAETLNTRASTAPVGDPRESNKLSLHAGGAPSTSQVGDSDPGSDASLEDRMDVGERNDDVQDGPGSTSVGTLLADENSLEGKHLQEEGSAEEQVENKTRPGTAPVGLGLGGLQPLPARSRRRTRAQPHLVQIADMDGAAAAGNGLPGHRGPDQTPTQVAGQNLLQSLISQGDRPSSSPQGSALEQSLGQLTQGLLPLLGSVGNSGNIRGEVGSPQMVDILGQLVSRTADANSGQGAFSTDMLRSMIGQLMPSPIMENRMQQVMTGVQSEDSGGVDQTATGLGDRSQGAQGGFDFAGIVQQMLPVVSQMFGGRAAPSAGQQVPSSANLRNLGEGAARYSTGQTNDSGRWREALSEEEATSWGETISADVEQQQLMEPQRPFSDIYLQGSPVAKRQKTDVEGVAQKLENGGLSEDVLRSPPELAADQEGGSNAPTNGGEISHLAQHVAGADGLSDAYMAVLFHDLAARVAAEPDFGDGSQLPNSTRVFEQQKAPEEPAGR